MDKARREELRKYAATLKLEDWPAPTYEPPVTELLDALDEMEQRAERAEALLRSGHVQCPDCSTVYQGRYDFMPQMECPECGSPHPLDRGE
jgi:hypothetical protein